MSSPPQQRALTWRVISIFAITAPINCYFLIQMEIVRYTFPTWVVPFSNVIFILTAVMLINGVIRLLKSDFALGQGELLLIYVTLSFATTRCWLRYSYKRSCLSLDTVSGSRRKRTSGVRSSGITSHNGSPFQIETPSGVTTSVNRASIVRITYEFGHRWWVRGCCYLWS